MNFDFSDDQHEIKRTARELLGSVYGRFTEGFETADLQEANRLLEKLRGPHQARVRIAP